MKPNNELDICAKCGEGKGEFPIYDDEGKSYWICEFCDAEMFEEKEITIINQKIDKWAGDWKLQKSFIVNERKLNELKEMFYENL